MLVDKEDIFQLHWEHYFRSNPADSSYTEKTEYGNLKAMKGQSKQLESSN